MIYALFLQGQDGSGHESWLNAGKIPMGTLLLLLDPYLTWTWGRAWLLLTCAFCLLRLKLHLFLPNWSPVCISHAPDSKSILGTQSGLGIVTWKSLIICQLKQDDVFSAVVGKWAVSLQGSRFKCKPSSNSFHISIPWGSFGKIKIVPRSRNLQTTAQPCTFQLQEELFTCSLQMSFSQWKICVPKQMFLEAIPHPPGAKEWTVRLILEIF